MPDLRWFDDGFDALALDAGRSVPIRIVLIILSATVLATSVDMVVAGLWMTAALGAVAWSYLANRPVDPGRLTHPVRWNRLASMIAASGSWTVMAVIYWHEGAPGYRLTAIALLFSLVIVGQSLSFKSRQAAFVFSTCPALALILLPLLAGGPKGNELLSFGVSLGMAFLYLAFDARQNFRNARMLRDAMAELEVQKEAAVAANRAKTQFLAMMSHELRTPMNGVLGMAHALTHSNLSSSQASHVDMLVRSGKGLMSILNDLLDISKIEAGKLELETVSFDLHELGERVRDLWSEQASSKGVRLIYDLAPDVPQWVSGDPTRLRQVMINLVSNALKFTSVGTVRLAIRPAGDDSCEISVSDTGLGIPEAQQDRLFQQFMQADVSTTRKFGGTGLGLAICKELATLMGGNIGVVSREGDGATFTLTLPLPAADPVELEVESNADVDWAGLRFLVADDNSINQAVARAILEAFGATIIVASNGLEAIQQLRCEDVDLVLMDVHMPQMDGPEALRRIRNGEAGKSDVPVIALTADAMAGVDAELLSHGFDDVAPKPINPAELAAKISALLAGATARKFAAGPVQHSTALTASQPSEDSLRS